MKNFIFIIFVMVNFSSCLLPKVGFSTLSINVTYTQDYCKGVAPNQEMLDSLSRKRIYVGKKLYLKKGSENNPDAPIFHTVTTNAKGVLVMPELFPGKYYLVDDDRLKPIDYSKNKNIKVIDQKCVNKWFKKPILVFEIKKNIKQRLFYEINFHKSCYLGESNLQCVDYIGPKIP